MTGTEEKVNRPVDISRSATQEDFSHGEVGSGEEEVELVMAKPPDGGWGWVVVFCSFMIHVIADGVTYTFGIFYMEFLQYFGESKGSTAWIASIMVGTTFCVGPFASGLTNQFGCRTITIVGSLLATFGLLVSTLAPSVTFLYFTIGICTGAGFGLMYLPAIVCVTCYFEKKRAFATGIAVCGSGIGTFILAPFIEWLVDQFAWQGAMLVVAGMVLNCCVFGALFRPLEKRPLPRRLTLCSLSSNAPHNGDLRKGSLPNGTIGNNGEVCFAPLKAENLKMHSKSLLGIDNHLQNSASDHQIRTATSMTLSCGTTSSQVSGKRIKTGPLDRKDVFYNGSVHNLPEYTSNPDLYTYNVHSRDNDVDEKAAKKPKGILARYFKCPKAMVETFEETMNFSLMADVIFLMFGFSNFFTNIGFNVPFVYTKDRAYGLQITNEQYASYLLSIIGIANTVGRIILGYLSDCSCVNRLWLYNGSLTLCGFATAFSYLCHDYTLMALYAAVFGATAGAYVSLTSVILVDLLGLEKLTNAFGLLLLFEGVACLIGPPITGWLHDYTGSYDPGFYVSGAMIALSGLMLFFIPCVQRSIQNKREQKTQHVEMAPSQSSLQNRADVAIDQV